MKIKSEKTYQIPPPNFIFGERYTIEIEGDSSPSIYSLERVVETERSFEYYLSKVK